MKDLSPKEIEQLILGYEELEADDRAVADFFLKRQPKLAARLKWHQDKENQARHAGAVSGGFWDEGFSDPADLLAQEESLRKILASLSSENITRTSSLTDRWRSNAKWLLPLAAVLALAFLWPRDGVQKMLIQDLAINQIILNDDGSRGGIDLQPADGVMHSGQAFALDFSLSEDSYVFVYHIGPSLEVSRVYPESIIDKASRHQGGQEHQIPSVESGELWILGTETGTESFLVAVGSQWPEGLDLLTFGSADSDRSAILEKLKIQLEKLKLQVELYEFEHLE